MWPWLQARLAACRKSVDGAGVHLRSRESGSKTMTFVQGSVRGKTLIALVALVAASLMTMTPTPAAAAAARPNGYPVTNVNLRAGPGIYYPVIVVVPAR